MSQDPHAPQLEAAFWDQVAARRTESGRIPMEADIRRATRVIPHDLAEEAIDPQMSEILEGEYRARFIDRVAHTPGGRVSDIGCGPGWLALELGRRGQTVDAYDLSPQAISVAKRMLAENPYQDGFGQVNYYVQDVTTVDLGHERYDAVSAWSAFHHLPNLPEFMERVWQALKPGGIVATLDDLPPGRLERGLQMFLTYILPSYNLTFQEKTARVLRRLRKADRAALPQLSPMEALSTQEIAPILYARFEVVENVHFNAFVSLPLSRLSGSDRLRYPIARTLVGWDRLLCRMGLVKGLYRIMIARKPAQERAQIP